MGAPTLLYVHGGPAQGCWDFMGSVGDALAKDVDVIATDQPGVLRSDPLPTGVEVTPDLLIKSYEDLRARLGIERYRSDAPHGKVVVIEGAGHFTFVERPMAYVAALRDFVARLPA